MTIWFHVHLLNYIYIYQNHHVSKLLITLCFFFQKKIIWLFSFFKVKKVVWGDGESVFIRTSCVEEITTTECEANKYTQSYIHLRFSFRVQLTRAPYLDQMISRQIYCFYWKLKWDVIPSLNLKDSYAHRKGR